MTKPTELRRGTRPRGTRMLTLPSALTAIGGIALVAWAILRSLSGNGYLWYAVVALVSCAVLLFLPGARPSAGGPVAATSPHDPLPVEHPSTRLWSPGARADGIRYLGKDRQRVAPYRSPASAAMDRYAEGDDGALESLYDALAPLIRQHFAHERMSRAEAEDLLNRTILRIHSDRGQFVRGADVVPWALALATVLRKSKRGPTRQRAFPSGGQRSAPRMLD